jgi:photosystem II stability/assembly factor-like uncharacterized protein
MRKGVALLAGVFGLAIGGLLLIARFAEAAPQSQGAWTGGGPNAGTIEAVAADPNNTSIVYTGVLSSTGLYKSVNAGVIWTPATNGLPANPIYAVLVHPVTSSLVYAGTFGNVFWSDDGAASWHPASGIPGGGDPVQTLAVNPVTPTVLYAGLVFAGVYTSADGGLNWSPSNTGITATVKNTSAFAVDPGAPETIYASIRSFFGMPVSPGGIFKSTNGGLTWDPVVNGLGDLNVFDIVIDPAHPSTLYAATGSAAVFKSIDSGTNWAPASTGLVSIAALDLEFDPSNPSALYVATPQGLFVTTDGATSWSRLTTTGLPSAFISELDAAPTVPTTMYGGNGSGVYSLELLPYFRYLPLVMRP